LEVALAVFATAQIGPKTVVCRHKPLIRLSGR
jgi:hypothetical protein